MEKRALDIGNMLNDVVNAMIKFIRGNELTIRLLALQVLVNLLMNAGNRVTEYHVELSKLITKLNIDRSIEIRQKSAYLLSGIASSSNGFTTVTFDTLYQASLKGLEDEINLVQEAYAKAIAIMHLELINAHLEDQEQTKIGLARGGSATNEQGRGSGSTSSGKASQRGSLSKFKDITSLKDIMSSTVTISSNQPKKIEENDFKTVIRNLIKTMIKSTPVLRAGYVAVLRHLIQLLLPTLLQDSNNLEWLVMTIINILKDPQITSLSYEEIVYFRCRLSHLFHKGISSSLSESNQILLCKTLYMYLSTTDIRTEHEIQFILAEICHLIHSLQEISISLQDELKSMINIQLRNPSFGVRATAAYVLMSLATMIPAEASNYFKDALTGAAIQAKQLLSFDEADYSASNNSEIPTEETAPNTTKKSPKDTERLQRMFYFHGHSLVISIFLKNENLLPTGLPSDLIMKAFDFGLEMLLLDIHSAPASLRHLVCSVIRAGSLIVSSCLNMGYKIAKERIHQLLDCCTTLLRPTMTSTNNTSGSSSTSSSNNPDLLYELMSTEAALVCISTLLWFCPDSLVYDENCLITIIDGLENAFKAIKTQYQSKFRGHFRFRTLHVILLECFAWLPPGSFPATCSQLFVEALRVFRDSIASNFESTCLHEFIPAENRILYLNGMTKPPSLGYWDIPSDEDLLILQLEHYSVALQKKESEAFLACFTKENNFTEFHRTPLHANDWMEPSPPCAFIDSRTVDASIALLAATFGHQTNEYQDKAIQLCSQALAQYLSLKSSSSTTSALGLFSNDEERKKKERKSYITIKNVTSVLSAIIRSFPFHNGMSLEMDLHWVQIVADKLFDILSYPNTEIKLAAANALGIFCSKIFGTHLMDSTGMKITQMIRSSIDKKNETLSELGGHVVALSSLWIHATNYPTVQNNIMNILFDTLKRVDCSISFRSNVIFSLATIIQSRSQNSQNLQSQGQDEANFIEKLLSIMEVHLVCGNLSDSSSQNEYLLLFLCLQRLINATVPLVLEFSPNAVENLIKMWSIIRNSFQISHLQDECANFLLAFSSLPVAIDPLDIVDFVKVTLKSPEKTTPMHLLKVVGCVKALVLMDTNIVVESGLDVELFKLLDWCVASSTATFSSSPFWGVELRSDISPIIIGDTNTLQRKIEEVMNLLVILNVQSNPDQNGTSWVLLSRAIALGLKEQTSAPIIEQSNEEGEGGAVGEMKSTEKEIPTLSSMTYIQYASWCRDVAIERGKFIQSTRLQLKYLSLRCAITAIIECKTSSKSNCHSDLLLARKTTQENLSLLGGTNRDDLVSLPCYLSLFMNDLISMGCACASFSIDDHRLLGLQTISIEYLQAIVDLFWNTLDPDDATTSSHITSTTTTPHPFQLPNIFINPEKKIMNQYMAQVISAIRPTLSAEWSPSLLWASGNLIFGFISSGLLTDKIIIKRLVKSFLGVLEVPDLPYVPRCYPSLSVRADIAIIQHINVTTNMARIFLLSTPYCSKFGHIDPSIQETIRSSFNSHLSEVFAVWLGVIIDTARLLQGHNLWPKIIPESDCRRGGITYPPHIDCLKIYRYYLYSLPYLLGAASMANQPFPPDQLLPFLTLNVIAMKYLQESQASTSKEEIILSISDDMPGITSDDMIETQFIYQNIQTLSKPLLYASLNQLFHQYTATATATATSDKTEYPIQEQILIIKYITENLIRDGQVINLEDSTLQYTVLLELFYEFLLYAENSSSSSSSSNTSQEPSEQSLELILVLWISHVALLRSIFPGLFSVSSDSSTEQEDLNIFSAPYFFPSITLQSYSFFVNNPSSCYWINNPRGIQVIESLFKNLELIIKWTTAAAASSDKTSQLCHLFSRYFYDLLINIHDYSTLYIMKIDGQQHFFHLIKEILCRLVSLLSGEVPDGLLTSLWRWNQHSIRTLHQSKEQVNSSSLFPLHSNEINLQDVTNIAQSTYEMWLSVVVEAAHQSTSKGPPSFMIPSTIQLTAILIDRNTPDCFLNGIILGSLKYLQSQSDPSKLTTSLSLLTSSLIAIIPNLIPFRLNSTLSVPSSNPSSVSQMQSEILLLQLFFLIFNLQTTEPLKALHLKTILPSLCLIIKMKGLNDPLSLICGKGITHIARTSPAVFKGEIMGVSDEYKLLLQQIMKVILEQQNQANSTTNTRGGNVGSTSLPAASEGQQGPAGGLKKIDISKFKKVTPPTTTNSTTTTTAAPAAQPSETAEN